MMEVRSVFSCDVSDLYLGNAIQFVVTFQYPRNIPILGSSFINLPPVLKMIWICHSALPPNIREPFIC